MGVSPGRDRLVTAIGIFKLVKAALLVTLGAAAISGLPAALVQDAALRVRWTGALSGHPAVQMVPARFLALDVRDLHEIGAAFIAYAVVFLIEGVGLLRGRRWAEWMTVIVTTSFIPFEIYELARRPGAGKVIAVALNTAIAAYLVSRRMRAAEAVRGSHFRPA